MILVMGLDEMLKVGVYPVGHHSTSTGYIEPHLQTMMPPSMFAPTIFDVNVLLYIIML